MPYILPVSSTVFGGAMNIAEGVNATENMADGTQHISKTTDNTSSALKKMLFMNVARSARLSEDTPRKA